MRGTRYQVWVKGRRRETERTLKVPVGANINPTKIKDHACHSIYFRDSDYDNLRWEKVEPK